MKIKANLKVNDSGFLFDPSTGESYSLNEMGVLYFNLISEGHSKEEVKTLVLSQFEVDEDSFEKSFLDFEARLRILRLLENE